MSVNCNVICNKCVVEMTLLPRFNTDLEHILYIGLSLY